MTPAKRIRALFQFAAAFGPAAALGFCVPAPSSPIPHPPSRTERAWPVVFVSVAAPRNLAEDRVTPNPDAPPGSLCVLETDGSVRRLTRAAEKGGSVRRPDISYNGKRVLFAMRPSGPSESSFHVYEIGLDGTGLRQITFDSGERRVNDYDPIYLPDGRLMFVSDRAGFRDEHDGRVSAQLWTIRPDGTDPQRVSANPSCDQTPAVLPDGRVAFLRGDHFRAFLRFSVWAVRQDGTFEHNGRTEDPRLGFHDLTGRYPGRFPAVGMDARSLPDGRLVGVAVADADAGAAGRLHVSDIRAFREAEPEPLWFPDTGLYKTPCPTPDGRVMYSFAPGGVSAQGLNGTQSLRLRKLRSLTARRNFDKNSDTQFAHEIRVAEGFAFHSTPDPTTQRPDYGIWTAKPDGSDPQKVYDEPGTWEIYAIPAIAHPVPPIMRGFPTVDRSLTFGTMVGRDVTLRGDDRQPGPATARCRDPRLPFHFAPGTVDRVRVIAALDPHPSPPQRLNDPTRTPGPPILGGAAQRPNDPATQRPSPAGRVLGEAPVYPDGSFAVRLPPDTAVIFQALDAKGAAIVSERVWTSVRPGETRYCGGCHNPHPDVIAAYNKACGANWTPESLRRNGDKAPLAEQTPVDLSKLRGHAYNYEEDIAPLLARRCVSCHSGAKPAAHLDLTPGPQTYRRLVSGPKREESGKDIVNEGGEGLIFAKRYIDAESRALLDAGRETAPGIAPAKAGAGPKALQRGGSAPRPLLRERGARRSLLYQLLSGDTFGIRTYRARVEAVNRRQDHRQCLTPGELRTLAAWIDTEAAFGSSLRSE